LLKKNSECFDKLSMNGKFSIISNSSPFALSLVKWRKDFFRNLQLMI